MDKEALARKHRELFKALCMQVEEKYFTSLEEDVTDHLAWSRLHAAACGSGCDDDYVDMIDECCMAATRIFLGDKAGE